MIAQSFFVCLLQAQTNPSPQVIPYAVDFGVSSFTILPACFKAWNSSSSPCVSTSIAEASIGISDQLLDTAQVEKSIGNVYGYSGINGTSQLNDGKFYIQTGSSAIQGTCQLVMAINTTGYSAITIGYEIEMVNPQPKKIGVSFQYRIGNSGSWTTLSNSYVYGNTNRIANQVDNFILSLPASANNQPNVQLRWASSRHNIPSGNSSGVGIDNIVVNGIPGSFSPLYFRSISSGNWNNPAVWESSVNNILWVSASRYPSNYDNGIYIRNPHTISTVGLPYLIVDQVVIENGACFWNASGTALVIQDGPTSVDFDVNGTIVDSSSISVIFSIGARWRLGPSGTIVKATHSSAKLWQLNYYGGINTIPSTSNWICRKPLGFPYEPTISSTNGGPPNAQAHYGNLFIENFSSSWNTNTNCRFSGSTNFPVIKGNLYIGGNGTGNVSFMCTNTHTSLIPVSGSIIIKSGCELKNHGTGFDLKGDLINNGLISYLGYTSKLAFSGNLSQTINGTGSCRVSQLQVNKTAGIVTVNQPVQVDDLLHLINGKFVTSSSYSFLLNDNATVLGASNSSFISGPVTKRGDDAFVFPTGKNSDYQPICISAGPVKTPFWTETFSNGCVSGCLGASYTGPNGAWLVSNTGSNGNAPNIWYVSGKECGNNSGDCQGSCTGDPSLHIGNGLTVIADSGGATYGYGNTGPLIFLQTNKKIESPSINCSGKTNLFLTFNYIEGGYDIYDNATLLYFNGSSWSTLIDLNKTSSGSCNPGSTWTNFKINLPSSANNNPNIKIAFQWVNDADGFGINPSFAVDDISLTEQNDEFTGEYFYTNPKTVFGTNILSPLNHVSSCEYWMLSRNAGTASKNISLSFDANSCGVTNLSDLRVAWYGSSWTDKGNSGTTGTISAGEVTSNLVSAFGPFTLSSVTTSNPLPVALLYFNARYLNNKVELTWHTASEINNSYFTVQKSKDGIGFENILVLQGAGQSKSGINYLTFDYYPFSGTTYYRLEMTDFNGEKSYSQIKTVRIYDIDFDLINISHYSDNPSIETTFICPESGPIQLIIMDRSGKLIMNHSVEAAKGVNRIPIAVSGMNKGLYFMQLLFKDQGIVKKFLY